MLDEPITIENADPDWSQRFEQEKAVIRSAIGEQIVEIEHFGSTAVPELAAKLIVDILIGLKHYPLSRDGIHRLANIGYECLGEAGIPGRLYFRKRQPLAFNLGAVEWNSKLWQDNLLLRDYLRLHSDARRYYEQQKRNIINSGCSQLLAYSEQKTRTVSELLKQAHDYFAEKRLTVNREDSKPYHD